MGERLGQLLDVGGMTVAVARRRAGTSRPTRPLALEEPSGGRPPRGFPIAISGPDRVPAASSRNSRDNQGTLELTLAKVVTRTTEEITV